MLKIFHQALYFFLVTLLPLSVLTACVPTGPTAYQYSQDVDSLFQTPTLLKDHTYYYIGTPVEPDGMIAIDNRFTMTSKAWSKIDINQQILDGWAFQVENYLGWWSCPYRGVKLFAPDGTQVGVGYSRWTFSVVKMPAPNEIVVYPPWALNSCGRRDALDDR